MILAVSLLIFSALFFSFLVGAPPTPHNVAGRVFTDSGNGVQNGIPVRINNTNQSTIDETQVFAPPIPQLRGSYSLTVTGEDGDTIIGYAWNESHYGTNTTNLSSTTTSLNIVIETVRPSELNVTIILPSNDSSFEAGDLFNVSANISNIGGQAGLQCNATLTVSNGIIVNVTDDQNTTNQLNTILAGSHATTFWNMSTTLDGVSNITVSAQCSSDGINFERLDEQHINVSVQDTIPPNVSLISPENNSIVNTGLNNLATVLFRYNVSDASPIKNCSLLLNNEINATNTSVQQNIPQSFKPNLPAGTFNWSVRCVDNSSQMNEFTTGFRNITVLGNLAPIIRDVTIRNPLDLTLGGDIIVFCNATVEEPNNITDIANVNATFFQESTGHLAPDDNNDHYTNTSCISVGNSTFEANYTCSFGTTYYANNGTWKCNITVEDNREAVSDANTSTIINELLAVEITPSILDYGQLFTTNITQNDSNLTVTNLGNIDFNISVDGYGVEDGDGLAMNCTKGTIPLSNQRYATNVSTNFAEMTSLSDTPTSITNFTLPQRIDDSQFDASRNNTYWKLEIPSGIRGVCNGTIIFRTVVI